METLPHNADAVQALVGALILDEGKSIPPFLDTYPHWRDLIYDEGLVSIIDAAIELQGVGQECEPIALAARTKAGLYLETRGGVRFLAGLINLVMRSEE